VPRSETAARESRALNRLPVGAAAVGAGFTLLVASVPGLRFAYENVTLHAAFETGEAMVALLLAYLALGRLRRTQRMTDLALAWSFAVFAATNLFVAGGLVSGQDERTVGFATWLAVAVRLFGAGAFYAAAVLPERAVDGRWNLSRWVLGASVAVLGVTVLFALGADAWLAEVIDPELSPESSTRPVVAGHDLVVVLQVLSATLFGAAAVAFSRKASRRGDELLYWLAAGAALSTFARVNYMLFPSLYSNWVYAGDILRLGGYLLYLVGGAREITVYFQTRAEVEVLRERRRMARDLHDGLTQELSFMRSHLASLAAGAGRPEMLGHVAAAAERALQESRRAIEALTEAAPDSVGAALERLASHMTSMHDSPVAVGVAVDADLEVPDRIGGALERIAREALSNALRHGRPDNVSIRVEGFGTGGRWARLTVEDDGRGFRQDGERIPRPGFGLMTMRERADQLGGEFRISSVVGEGTIVEVDMPLR